MLILSFSLRILYGYWIDADVSARARNRLFRRPARADSVIVTAIRAFAPGIFLKRSVTFRQTPGLNFLESPGGIKLPAGVVRHLQTPFTQTTSGPDRQSGPIIDPGLGAVIGIRVHDHRNTHDAPYIPKVSPQPFFISSIDTAGRCMVWERLQRKDCFHPGQ